MKQTFSISGRIVDVHAGRIFAGTVGVEHGRIVSIREGAASERRCILPGFIDAHVHVESSMLVPAEFARLAAVHGTVGAVCDPHEIANVLGSAGIEFMVQNGKSVPFKFCFGVPSCVPATGFETSGACLDAEEVARLLARPDFHYLSEMMNFPGVLQAFPDVAAKLTAARRLGKPIDGHAPGLRGAELRAYAAAGISTDHESFEIEEAREKIACGMSISIREGSAAKNFDALIALLNERPDRVMFCSDDKHPNDLVRGHINSLAARAVAAGCDPLLVLRAACVNPVRHYAMPVGLLREGDAADFIVLEDLVDFVVQETFVDGVRVAERGRSLISVKKPAEVNRFERGPLAAEDIECRAGGGGALRVIEVLPGELITREVHEAPLLREGKVVSDPRRDVLKLVVVNRYQPAPPAIGFVKGFGLRQGALASTVAHDSHNLIAVGTGDDELLRALNAVIAARGGVALTAGDSELLLPLPIAGLMSAADGYQVAERYEALDRAAKELGSALPAPFMTLSFLALLVIPALKLGDRGLFNGERFEFVPLFVG